MDSSSLLQLHPNRVHHTNDPQFDSVHQQLFDSVNSRAEPSKPEELPFSLPLPNFLIDPQDGQFTPYFDRSQASSPGQEYDDPFDFNPHSQTSSPVMDVSPLRSRATSIALKKLIEIQAQMLLDISAAWKKKYPSDELEGDIEDGRSLPATRMDGRDDDEQDAGAGSRIDGGSKSLFPRPHQLPRRHHSISAQPFGSSSASIDRLSLNDHKPLRKGHMKIDAEAWKREALESKLKQESLRNWIKCLPLAEQFEKLDVDHPPSSST